MSTDWHLHMYKTNEPSLSKINPTILELWWGHFWHLWGYWCASRVRYSTEWQLTEKALNARFGQSRHNSKVQVRWQWVLNNIWTRTVWIKHVQKSWGWATGVMLQEGCVNQYLNKAGGSLKNLHAGSSSQSNGKNPYSEGESTRVRVSVGLPLA